MQLPHSPSLLTYVLFTCHAASKFVELAHACRPFAIDPSNADERTAFLTPFEVQCRTHCTIREVLCWFRTCLYWKFYEKKAWVFKYHWTLWADMTLNISSAFWWIVLFWYTQGTTCINKVSYWFSLYRFSATLGSQVCYKVCQSLQYYRTLWVEKTLKIPSALWGTVLCLCCAKRFRSQRKVWDLGFKSIEAFLWRITKPNVR